MTKIPTENNEVSLKEIIDTCKEWYTLLISKWKVIVLSGLIGATLGLAYSFTKKPIYTASLSFALEDNKSGGGLGSALGLASSLGLDINGGGGSIFSGTNLAELLKSRSMVEQTLLMPVPASNGKMISLAELYIKNSGWREKWKDDPKYASVLFLPNSNRKHFTRVHDSILGVMYKNLSKSALTVEQKDKKIAIVTIDMKSGDELFSKYFAEALARKVSDFYISTKSKKARMNMEILERQTDSIRRELNAAITGVAVANDNTFSLNPALNVRRTPSVRKQVDVQANTAILTELVKQTELAKVTLRRETPLIQVIDSPILPLDKKSFGKIKGIILGGFLGGFLSSLFLIIRLVFKHLV
ncbi:Wzz/FepE/Etk N-terminal domain-containing protein [Flavobacterium sp. Fl-318]|uniref:Wzz/FepE/Etk N-terminal domain-containing protein n=1 Tax=Flavobacterium cupriresistens TaxID=2893885 RepID=A0ABU4RC11_9FLAO|nr:MULTISPECIES: Wzz/FepE/Etk N-terminal domain-containing protein [unclassified Flavobacterium]MDX6190130.1 Wzz/FepE/Etk N-terminal domain-containing protein [Flavobacterium sp. Fl-318]UFH42951.1 Wzz/FepE/Etk N-terminal domain-containing protein [Flavobacterium sp. F-323]